MPDTDLMMYSAIVGFVSSMFIIPVIQQPHWTTQVRAAVTFAYCVLAGLGTAYFTGEFDIANLTTSILSVFVTAIATYKGLAEKTTAPVIEAATSVRPPPSV